MPLSKTLFFVLLEVENALHTILRPSGGIVWDCPYLTGLPTKTHPRRKSS